VPANLDPALDGDLSWRPYNQTSINASIVIMSRSESQGPQFGRRRSNTAQSILRPVPVSPLKIGDSAQLNLWVHEPKDSPNVMFNHASLPGVSEGDMLMISVNNDTPGFLFIVPKEDGNVKPQLHVCIYHLLPGLYSQRLGELQLSIPKPLADAFQMTNNTRVSVTKARPSILYSCYSCFTSYR
jgi:DEP domain-containing protein 5